jgi:hypothetical protein
LIRLTIDAERTKEAYQYSNSRVLRHRKLASLHLPGEHRLPPREDLGMAPNAGFLLAGGNHDDSRVRSSNVEQRTDESDLGRAGRTTAFAAHPLGEDDPRQLAVVLARYEFVAQMLRGKKSVAEVGCVDAFGSRIVMQSTGNLMAYDSDPLVVEAMRRRRSERWPVAAHVHDILEAPLPELHDGIFSLDLIKRIPRTAEQRFLVNLRDSLASDGSIVIGSPVSEFGTDAALPVPGEVRVNGRTGDELNALLKNYFKSVFLFSFNDEVLHAGFSPAAQYLIAVCCQKKQKIQAWR